MKSRLLLCSLMLPLVGCGFISMPMEALEDSLKRDDKVYALHGRDLNLVDIGDGRDSVYLAWGHPRPTLPTYPEFDLYLVVYRSDGVLRVLPGDYSDLSRTSPAILRVSYHDERVSEIRVLGGVGPGSKRTWCDERGDRRECSEIFIRHFVGGDASARNPLIIAAREAGVGVSVTPPVERCEIFVYPSDVDSYWSDQFVYSEIRRDKQPFGVITDHTYLRFVRPPGALSVQANPELWAGGGDLEEGDDLGANIDCQAGQRTYLSVGPRKTGFWAVNRGVRVTEVAEDDALDRLSVLKEIRLPSVEPEAALSQ